MYTTDIFYKTFISYGKSYIMYKYDIKRMYNSHVYINYSMPEKSWPTLYIYRYKLYVQDVLTQ